MDKSTQKILVIGGLGLLAWYLWSKKKTSETTAKTTTGSGTGSGTGAAPAQRSISNISNDAPNILLNTNTGVVAPSTPNMPYDVRVAKDEAQRRTPPSTINKEPSIKPPIGRYRFKEDRSDSKPIGAIRNITTSTGTPKSQQSQTVTYKKGDVVNVQKFFWNIASGDYSVILSIAGLTYSFPLASLEKVDDATPTNAPQITKKAAGGMAYFSGKRPLTLDNLLM